MIWFVFGLLLGTLVYCWFHACSLLFILVYNCSYCFNINYMGFVLGSALVYYLLFLFINCFIIGLLLVTLV